MLDYGPVSCRVDLDAPGKRSGWLDLSHSDNRHDFSTIPVPVGVVRGGPGPVVLVTGGNHGDEYEGQVIARRLFERLDPADLAGAVIVLPALNLPAVLAGRRVSPLDGGNMNRSFPGAPDRGPTAALAGFVSTHLFPRCSLAIDLHSGGTDLDFITSSYLCLSPDAAQNARALDLCRTLALPWAVVAPPSHTAGDLNSAAQAAGCAVISCELGGSGRVSQKALAQGWAGVLRLLAAEGALHPDAAARLGATRAGPTRFADLGAGAAMATVMHHGLAEPLVRLGEEVAAGQTIALLRDPFDLSAPAREIAAPAAGLVLVRRRNALVAPGDHLILTGPEIAAETVLRAADPRAA